MPSLVGKRVLLVEDEYLLALDLEQALEAAGAMVIGPFASVSKALAALAQPLDLAVMNIRVRDGNTYPLAATLRGRDIPIVFATGQDLRTEPVEWHTSRWITKPYTVEKVIELLESALCDNDGSLEPHHIGV